jgi:hypothetical protein
MLESVDAPYPNQAAEKEKPKPVEKDETHGVATGNVVETGNTAVSTGEDVKVVLPGEKVIEDKPLNVEKKNLIDLNFDSLDTNGKEFVNKWNIEIEKGFDDSIMLEQSTQITIRITNKVS